MPTYDYRCEGNNKVYEVKHAMALAPKTWGELCEISGMDLKGIAGNTPVQKVLSAAVVKPTSLKSLSLAPPCQTGGCEGGGACMM